MEKQDLNIAEILKSIGAEKGYPLYSPIIGGCTLDFIHPDGDYVVIQSIEKGINFRFCPNGKFVWDNDAECLLFPSKDNRDWSTVKPKKPKKQEHRFKPFEKVLVRDTNCGVWVANLFSNYWGKCKFAPYWTISGSYAQCIPYEGNEHLLGTTDKPEEQE